MHQGTGGETNHHDAWVIIAVQDVLPMSGENTRIFSRDNKCFEKCLCADKTQQSLHSNEVTAQCHQSCSFYTECRSATQQHQTDTVYKWSHTCDQ